MADFLLVFVVILLHNHLKRLFLAVRLWAGFKAVVSYISLKIRWFSSLDQAGQVIA